MRSPFHIAGLFCAFFAVAGSFNNAAVCAAESRGSQVALLRVPDKGIQPQVEVGPDGVLHMIYFSGTPAAGDIYYVTSTDGGKEFSKPILVNSEPGSAVAMGNIRGAHLALGKKGRAHVAWMGSQKASPRTADNKTPMLYTRFSDDGRSFEPQRNLISKWSGLDGGGSVAADREGNVYVAWHAPGPGEHEEANRRIWVTASHNDGKNFAEEVLAHTDVTGACACCGMKAFADKAGTLHILYRTASNDVHRDMRLITSSDMGRSFESKPIHPWEIGHCMMSSAAICDTPTGVSAAWETEEQIYFASISATSEIKPIPAPNKKDKRKHPAIATNANGETLLAWTERMAWNKGGSLAWQVFNAEGKPISGRAGKIEGVPTWSLVAAGVQSDGQFLIVY